MTAHSTSIEIPLTHGFCAQVSAEDAGLVGGIEWRLMRTPRGKMYARGTASGSRVLMHRFLLGASGQDFVDHADGNGLNNTRQNLRLATTKQNRWNAKPSLRSSSKFKGVKKASGGWTCSFIVSGIPHYVGFFKSPIIAALAYNVAAKPILGKWFSPNIIDRELAQREIASCLAELETKTSYFRELLASCN